MKIYFVSYSNYYPEDGYMESPTFLHKEDAEMYLKDNNYSEDYDYQSICEVEVLNSYKEYRKQELIEEAEEAKKSLELQKILDEQRKSGIPMAKMLRRRVK